MLNIFFSSTAIFICFLYKKSMIRFGNTQVA